METNKLAFIQIKDEQKTYSGANQYWLPNKFHAVSGCGPTTAAEILAYLSDRYPESCGDVYRCEKPVFDREAFISFITHVREYVTPGLMGLTDIDFYERRLIAFALTRGASLDAEQIDRSLPPEKAFEIAAEVIDSGLPLALLILRNPYDDIDDYTWHWMTVIGYDRSSLDLIISTHGREHRLDFRHVWHNDDGYFAGLVYFWPKEALMCSMSIS